MMQNKLMLLRWIAFLVLLIALTGCAWITKQYDTPLDTAVTGLTEERVHYYRVLDELGPPANISALADGFAFQYETVQIDEQQFGISSSMELLRWNKLAYGSARVSREMHTYVFDREGYVQAYGSKKLKEDIGSGMSFQFIVKVTQIVDTSYLETPSAQHAWGYALLQPLSVALNREQSMDSGLYGLEQRGTPTEIGQRTLEFYGTR